MPNCDFFAAGTDHKAVLEFVLSQGDSDVYELSSRDNQPLRSFRSLADLEEHYSIADWNQEATPGFLLQLHPHGSNGRFVASRTDFEPDDEGGATFQYSAEGWGLVQLYLQTPHAGRLGNSHTNHNSFKRAAAWAGTRPELGNPADWDWDCVTAFSRRLNRFIRSLAVAKTGSRVILPHAAKLQAEGVELC
jgi:hypothetical protein